MNNVTGCDTLLSRNEIPIIDLTLREERVKEIVDQLHSALTDNGFVFFTNHGIPEEKITSVYKVMDEFCALPDDVKDYYMMKSSRDVQGYIPLGKEKLYNNDQIEMKVTYNILKLSDKLPSKEVPNMKNTISEVTDELINLTNFILKLIAEAQGLNPDFLIKLHEGMLKEDNQTAFRMLYYPPIEENVPTNVTRCGEHSDWGTLTLLTQDGEGGLEIFKNGEWRRVGHLPGAILMNVGDMMEVWTSSMYKSAKHRVVIPEDSRIRNKGRHSAAFFAFPKISTLVDSSLFTKEKSGNIVQYNDEISDKKVTALEYLQQKRNVALSGLSRS